MGNPADRIDCYKCAHFAVTWEQNTPRACRFFGFKTAKLPSVAVLESSGTPCEAFLEKKRPNKNKL